MLNFAVRMEGTELPIMVSSREVPAGFSSPEVKCPWMTEVLDIQSIHMFLFLLTSAPLVIGLASSFF